MADYVCFREYPDLLDIPVLADRYLRMYREIANRTSFLVSEWLRVGYVQGNMNSDNSLVGGRTVDYGPFGFLETFDPFYQPFTSDADGKFSYIRQPTAMSVNIAILGETVEKLVEAVVEEGKDTKTYLDEVKSIAGGVFEQRFMEHYSSMQKEKLGLYDDETDVARENKTSQLYKELEQLMYRSRVDFTVFFRLLSTAAGCGTPTEVLFSSTAQMTR